MAAPDIVTIARNPLWFPHRFDPGHDAVHFVELTRERHRAATFVTDEYLPPDAARIVLRRSDAVAAAGSPAPMHYIFHSAYCCSTLLARAFDLPGVTMGLKEPVLLNDLVGWGHRGGASASVAAVLDDGLTLLARPFAPGEAVIVKPSNVVNPIASAMLTVRPRANALLLHAPLRTYLGSIARKGMTGRMWVRDLLVKQLRSRFVDLGFDGDDHLGQTDLQVAAVGWLAQHAAFARIVAKFGVARVRTIDSETLMAEPRAAMAALARLFALPLDAAAIETIVTGPAFTRHSKSGTAFGGAARIAEQDAASPYADEIEKVAVWAEAVAAAAGLGLVLDAPLVVAGGR